MELYNKIVVVISFACVYSQSYAMDNNKPKPPSPVCGKKSISAHLFQIQSGVLKSRPNTFENQASSKSVPVTPEADKDSKKHNDNITKQSSKTKLRAAELVAASFVKLSQGRPLSSAEQDALQSHIHAMRLSNQ